FLHCNHSLKQPIKHPHIISLHLPPNKQTFHLFHKQIFPKVNKPAILLNPPPPPLINTPHLIHALNHPTLYPPA
ncbi:NAD(P)-dependent oxidoreductase, partial [Staphylococcus capitis]|uniref:NAD(P)-dependent oxidoreductase n=1 Tax=Staphylococcus capitis TaxID=29388 RepID=UPI003709618E